MLEALTFVVCLANLAILVYNGRTLGKRISELERVGVLVTADRKAEVMAQPMSPREKIRWIERRMNGSLKATP